MPACVRDSREAQISRCMDELATCREHINPMPRADLWCIGQMDWLEELHGLLYDWEKRQNDHSSQSKS